MYLPPELISILRFGNSRLKSVMIVMNLCASDDGLCTTSVRDIARYCEMSETAVRRSIRKLVLDGYIDKIRADVHILNLDD